MVASEFAEDGDWQLLNSPDCVHEFSQNLIATVHVTPSTSVKRKIAEVDVPARRTFVSTDRHSKHLAAEISEMWLIGPKRAEATLKATTQYGTRSAILPIGIRYRADHMFNLKRLNCKMATDTLYSDHKSLLQNTCGQIYTHKCDFAVFYPLPDANGESINNTLLDFTHEYGAPEHLTFDGAKVQVGRLTKFQQSLRRMRIAFKVSAPRRPDENPSESQIRRVKTRWYIVMVKKNVHVRLWDFCFNWICETGNRSVSSSKYAKGRTGIEHITGETPDISEYLEFGFYDWVVFRSNAGVGPTAIGKWLGVSHKVGQLMSYWILPVSGIPISCVTVQRLTNLEQQTDVWKQRMVTFEEKVNERLDIQDSSVPGFPDINFTDQRLSVDSDPEFLEEYKKGC